MKTISDPVPYFGIAPYYEKWCLGDPCYLSSGDFYCDIMQQAQGPILELGIGTGRIARRVIRQKAVDITGIDISSAMLDQCETLYQQDRLNGQCKGSLTLRHMNMLDLEEENFYELVCLPFRTIGHLLTSEDVNQLFAAVYRSLKPNGYFVTDHYMFCSHWAHAHDDVDIPMYQDHSLRIADHYQYNFSLKLMDCTIKVNDKPVDHFKFRWIPVEEIRFAARRSGFLIEQLFGDYDRSCWSPDSPNQIWVLKKAQR